MVKKIGPNQNHSEPAGRAEVRDESRDRRSTPKSKEHRHNPYERSPESSGRGTSRAVNAAPAC